MDAEPQITKLCPRCEQTLPASAFWICASRKDGLQSVCKHCAKAKYKDGPLRIKRPPKPSGVKRCCGCKQTLPKDDFHRNKYSPDGIGCYCNKCGRANSKKYSEKYYGKFHKTRQRTPFAKENGYLKRTYGITYPQYLALLESQGGVCAICGESPTIKRLKVDHSHKTGNIRGLLCSACNMGLGDSKDDIRILLAAITYISRWLSIESSEDFISRFPFE